MDQGQRQAVLVAFDGDPVAVAVGEVGEPGHAVVAGLRAARAVEVEDQAAVGVGDRVVAVRVAGQQRAGPPRLGPDGRAGHRVRVADQEAVGGDVEDADGVDLKALVDGGGPGEPHEAAGGQAGLGAAGEQQRQDAGYRDVGLRQEHPARGQVDRVGVVGDALPGLAGVGALRGVVRQPPQPRDVGDLLRDTGTLHRGAAAARGDGEHEVGDQLADTLGRVLHEVLDHLGAGADRVVRGDHEPGGQAVERGQVLGRVRQVVRVHRVDAAHEVDDARRRLDDPAVQVHAHDLGLLEPVP